MVSAGGRCETWPVGQEVKTGASHAPNVGSIPARGTTISYGRSVGAVNGEVPPVPIPNTAVKLTRADNTWRAAAREDR